MDKSTAEINLERIQGWIKAVDTKISIFLAFQGVMFTLLLVPVSKIVLSFNGADCLGNFLFFVLVFGIQILIVSLYKSISTLVSSIKNPHPSLIFFGDISKLSLKEFRKKMETASTEEQMDDLLNQTYVSAQIATKKHSDFSRAVWFFLIGVAAVGISLLVKYSMYGHF